MSVFFALIHNVVVAIGHIFRLMPGDGVGH